MEYNKPKYKKGDRVVLTKDYTYVTPSHEIVGTNEDGWPTFAPGTPVTYQKKGDEGVVVGSITIPIGRGLIYYQIEGFVDPYPIEGYIEEALRKVG